MSKEEWKAGLVLADRYRLEERIGSGGMGEVWRGQHLALKSPIAIKLLSERVLSDEEAVGRFMREAQAAAALRSPNVVQVFDHGVHDECPFIVMELLEGESLRERLSRAGQLSVDETADVLTQVARAIARAHKRGIVHRDLKPGNIQLVDDEDGEHVKVLDFGIAKISEHDLIDSDASTQTGTMLGTPYYMSPEQARGVKTIDHRTDLWALGVIAFQCLTGKRPFEGETVGDLVMKICSDPIPVPSQVAAVPDGFDAWFRKATQRDPEQRFQSARAMAGDLRAVLLKETTGQSKAAWARLDATELTRPAAESSSEANATTVTSNAAPPTSVEEPLGSTGLTQSKTLASAPPSEAERGSTTPRYLLVGVVALLAVASIVVFRSSTPESTSSLPEAGSPPAAGTELHEAPSARAQPAAEFVAPLEPSVSEPSASPSLSASVSAAPAEVPAPRPTPRVVPRPAPLKTAPAPRDPRDKKPGDLGI